MKDKKCIFCKIINKEIPAEIIYEDKKTIAFLDIAPAQKKGGHTLVLPKRHYEIITEIEEKDAKVIMNTLQKLSKALLNFGEGLNIIQNNKETAGQAVNHIHFHLIPRFSGDGITLEKWTAHKYPNEKELKTMADKIKSFL